MSSVAHEKIQVLQFLIVKLTLQVDCLLLCTEKPAIFFLPLFLPSEMKSISFKFRPDRCSWADIRPFIARDEIVYV